MLFNSRNDKVTDHFSQIAWGNTRYIGCGKRTYPQRRYKRETDPNAETVDESNLRIDEDGDQENLRQPRKIYGGQYTNRVSYNNERNNYNWNHYEQSYDSELRAYNASLQQYLEKYKNDLKHKGDYLKQLDQYKTYVEQLSRFDGESYEGKVNQFNDLRNKYETYKNIHDRQIYYEKKLNSMQANKKKLNPVISKYYDFTTPYPITAGIVHEYYVCNYGPTGNFPGARMYTKGQNSCNGLCQGNFYNI